MLNKLTEQAAQRFAAMEAGVEEAQNRVHAAQRRLGDIERQMRMKNQETQAEEVAVLQQDLDRQRSRQVEAQHSFLALSRMHTAIRTWIAQLPPSIQLEDVEEGFADLESGELYHDAVVRVRCVIEDLGKERSAIRRAVETVDEICARADAHVDAIATRGRPALDGRGVGDQAAALLVWLFSDQIKKRMRGELEARRKSEPGLLVLSAAEREQRLASIDQLILAKEREEEWIVREAEEQDTIILRREKASPLAILGLQVAKRVKASRPLAQVAAG
jgi:hypothetical protein